MMKSMYPGKCAACGGEIRIGDGIVWNRTARRGKRAIHFNCCSSENGQQTQQESQQTTQAEEQALTPDSNGKGDSSALDALADVILARVEAKLEAKVNQEDVAVLVEKALEEYLPHPTVVEVKDVNKGETRNLGAQHKMFPTLLTVMQARQHNGLRCNVWIAGPAGTGKTSAVERAAEALGLDYASTGALTESYKVFGFYSPGTGQYTSTPFRRIWEHGGVFLFDDCDGSDPNVMVELNNALANGACTFPDGLVKRNPDCILILTANTWGFGATNDYVGRNKQDAAFLDRFVRLYWDTDEELEKATCPDTAWCLRVQEIRHRVKEKGIKVLVTPRASYYGAALLAVGLPREQVEEIVLKGAMTADQWESVR